MDYAKQEEYEYNEFMCKLIRKMCEMKYDFDNLSSENRNRVEAELQQAFLVDGIVGIMQHLQKWSK